MTKRVILQKQSKITNLALEINPSSFGANYNLGALYFNYGVKLKDEASNASNNAKIHCTKKASG